MAFAFFNAYCVLNPYYFKSSFVFNLIIPICLAIAAAVGGWSPVTMITLIPADWHFLIAKGTVYLGGSINEINPTNT